tara:strand:+ start:1122 stop:1415 length:294 start_codon:yes stop_codon:yes gene_type:complete
MKELDYKKLDTLIEEPEEGYFNLVDIIMELKKRVKSMSSNVYDDTGGEEARRVELLNIICYLQLILDGNLDTIVSEFPVPKNRQDYPYEYYGHNGIK